MRSRVLSLVVFLAVAVPTSGLVALSWQWLGSQERQRIEQRRDDQIAVVETTRDRITTVLDQLIESEERVAWTRSFHLMEPVDNLAVASTHRASKWPAIVQGRFVVGRDGSVRGPSVVPVPELVEEVAPLRRAADLLAERADQTLGQNLRAARRLAAGSGPDPDARPESLPCSDLEGLLVSVSTDTERVLGCEEGQLVTVSVGAPEVLAATRDTQRAIAIVRIVEVTGYGTLLTGALLDVERLLQLPAPPPGGEIALERKPSPARAGPGRRVVGEFDVDPRLPDYSIVLRESVPTPIERSGRTWRALFAGFCLVLTLVLTATIWAMHRFVAGTILLNQEREHFVAAVTHELRTPLAAIRLFAELLQGAEGVREDEAAARFVLHVLEEAARLESLIENVLAITAIEHSTQTIEPTRGDLGDAVEALLDRQRPYLERRGVTLEVQIESGMPPVQFDRLAVERILSNLLENAVKYAVTADSRSIEIDVRVDGSHAELQVADRGPGLGSSGGEGIFRRFARSGTHRAGSKPGVGLGLAIVRELAELQGGQASARNREGGGAVFCVRFPLLP